MNLIKRILGAMAVVLLGISASQAQTLFVHDKPTWNFDTLARQGHFKPVPYSSDQYKAYIQTSLSSGDAPDMFTWWTGDAYNEVVKTGLVADVDELWKKKIAAGEYSEGLRNLFLVNGKPYAIPLNVARWTVFYKKDVFNQLNLKEPHTWSELEDVAAKLKAAGYTPFQAAIDWGWNGYIWFQELMIRMHPDAYLGLFTGKTAYNGAEVKDAFDQWRSWYEKGYFSDPRVNEQISDFVRGKAVMYLMGEWIVGNLNKQGLKEGKDFGSFIMPNKDPRLGNQSIFEVSPILISKKAWATPAKRASFEYLGSVQAADELAKSQNLFAGNAKAEAPNVLVKQTSEVIKQGNYLPRIRWWEGTPAEIQNDLVAQLNAFMLNPSKDNEQKVMNNMQKINSDYFATHD